MLKLTQFANGDRLLLGFDIHVDITYLKKLNTEIREGQNARF